LFAVASVVVTILPLVGIVAVVETLMVVTSAVVRTVVSANLTCVVFVNVVVNVVVIVVRIVVVVVVGKSGANLRCASPEQFNVQAARP